MSEPLELLKLDLGIKNPSKDEYFNALIDAAIKELQRKGIRLNLNETDDIMLVVDYAAWQYRRRTWDKSALQQENAPLPQNLQLRIRNRIIRGRAIGKEK